MKGEARDKAGEAKKRQQATLPKKGQKGFNVSDPGHGHNKGRADAKAGESWRAERWYSWAGRPPVLFHKVIVKSLWRAEQQRIRAEANQKRSEAAKERERTEAGTFEPVVQQVVGPLVDKNKSIKAKAAASKTNAGAVARGDKLAKERPDLAEMVRLGNSR